MNKRLIFIIIVLCFVPFAYSQETLTITTYYPAPFGVYTNLRLFPSAQPACTVNDRGTMYYDNGSNQILVCSQDAAGNLGWLSVGAWNRNGNNIFLNHNGGWQVGINTDNPQAALDVDGGIRVRPMAPLTSPGTCDANTEGTIKYNRMIHYLQYCDSKRWQVLAGFGGAFTTGDLNYYGMAAPYMHLPVGYLYPGSPAYNEWCETGNALFPNSSLVPQCGCPADYIARYAGTVLEGAPPGGVPGAVYWDTIWVCTPKAVTE